jgi:tetratricopeptide (TPR) repeat protein
MSKPVRSVAKKSLSARKSSVSKKKPVKASAARNGNGRPKPAPVPARRGAGKVEARDSSKMRQVQPKASTVQKLQSKEYSDAVHAYEAGLKFMHAEEYAKAIKAFRELIAEHADEPEIRERSRVLMQACEKKLHENARTVLRSAEDHYNMGIAEMNRRQLDAATQHLQHGLKLAPKAEHILYAMAVVNALKGNRDEALSFLRQSIQYRPENRFLAARDSDFQTLTDDADFKQLVFPSEK